MPRPGQISTIRAIVALALIFGLTTCSDPPDSESAPLDILISGGTIYSGDGSPGVIADIGIRGDSIVFVGDSTGLAATEVVDVAGMIVTPGFIDPHTHALDDLLSDERNANVNYLTQGVTTVFNGNDGGGPVAVGYILAEMERDGIGTNAAFYIGHGTIREAVIGLEDRAPTDDELAEMKAMVASAMQDGALGLSTGLYYAPGFYATTEEVIALARVAAEYGGVYDSHIRDESTYSIGLLGAVAETLRIGREAGLPVHIAHIKALGVDVWGQSADVIQMIEEARAAGQQVTADQYPWRASGTSIAGALVPRWALAGGNEALLARLDNKDLSTRIRAGMTENMRRRGGAETLLLTARDKDWSGLTLAEFADVRGEDPITSAIYILRQGGSSVASFNMSDVDIEAFMAQPWVMTGSDGSGGHPRKFATYPEKYHTYVMAKGVLSLADFVHRSTGQVADTFRLCDRGYLREGYKADILIFDPDAFAPRADYRNPEELSVGVLQLLVNGGWAIRDGAVRDGLHGRGLKRSGAACAPDDT